MISNFINIVFDSVNKTKNGSLWCSIGKEKSFLRNNLKWFHSWVTHMHLKKICLMFSSYEWQIPKVKNILFWFYMLWNISFLPIRVYYLFLPKYFCEVGVWPDDSNTEYISPVVSLFNTITLVFFIRWWFCMT